MAAFGFSVGDMIAGLKVIYASCEALRSASSSQLEYCALRAEIQSLLIALEAINDLDIEHRGTEKQWAAINASVSSCKACIDAFLRETSKYDPHLQEGAKGGWTAGYRRIKWAIYKKEDITRFRAQLERHASSINMLLITFQTQGQMGATNNAQSTQSATGMEMVTRSCALGEDNVTALLQGLTLEQRQFFRMLISQNEQLQQSLDDIRQLIRLQAAIPPQVILQKPVILLDAFGKIAPFHLDFIDSLDAFVAVLKIRSEQAGVRNSGLKKLDKREFCIRDTHRRRNIDLDRPWTSVFRPGQNVDMSMVFRRRLTPTICPECSGQNAPCEEDGEIECDFCGLWYHHVREEESQMQELLPLDPDPPTLSLKTRGARDISESDLQESNFAGFRRVRIIAMVIRPPAMHKTLDDLKQNLVEHSPSNSAEPVDPQDAGHGLEKDANYAAFRTKQKIQHQARIWQLRKHRTQKTAAANSNAQGGQQVPDSSTNNNPDKRSVPSSTGRCKSCSAKFTVTGKVLLSTQYCSQCLHDQAFSGVHRSKEPEPRDMSRERSMFGHEVPSNYQYDQETGAVSSTSEHQYRFVCDAPGCGTSFRRRYELVLHLRTHLEGYTLKKQREEVQWTLIDARMR